MRTIRRAASLLVVSAALLLFLSSSSAARSTARGLDIDGSAISSGMGGASAAVFWSAEPNYWANPALLGYYRGVRYQRAWSQLVPGLASDVFLESNRVTLGACGVGVEVGRGQLDYGKSIVVEEGEEIIGVYDDYEKVRLEAVGVSLAGLADGLAPGSRLAGLGRDFDLAFGIARKSVQMHLGVYVPEVSGPCYDVGVLARAGYDFGGPVSGLLPIRMDAAFGAAVLNANDVTFRFMEEVPPSRLRRLGGSLRLAVGRPAGWSGLLRGLDPLISIGGAWDAEHVQAGDDDSHGYDVTHVGAEITLLNVLSARVGHVTDREGDIEDLAWGVGVGLPIAGVAGIRFDYAEYPQSTDLPRVIRHTASVYADPLALWRLTR